MSPMWLLKCAIFVRIPWKPCNYCVASFCGSTGKPKSPGLYGIGAVQGHLFVLYYQQVERHSGEAIAIARTPNRERRLKTRTPERYPVPDEKCRDALAARGKQRRKKQRCSSGTHG